MTRPFLLTEEGNMIYKQGDVAPSVLEAYCSNINGTDYTLMQEEVIALQSANLSVSEYLTTVLRLLPKVATLDLPCSRCTLIGYDNVGGVLEAVSASLPYVKIVCRIDGLEDCYIGYSYGLLPLHEMQGYCAGLRDTMYQLTDNTVHTIKSAGLSVSQFLTTMLPLLSRVTSVWIFHAKIPTLGWCEGLPERINSVYIRDCSNIQDYTPLLKMKGLKHLRCYTPYDTHNPVLSEVLEELTIRGVKCKF
ncbi:hypothetical protein ADEAN_000183100 [Angomonas deanei]|uniref:Uncharacterized protein n=1 Tax=Angomonas deanei TaxID=59799 RepID=A0A7G2C3U8_9TRYP|nr:hypothetical protein ADEAN_000183100 [Angomonas deanei]